MRHNLKSNETCLDFWCIHGAVKISRKSPKWLDQRSLCGFFHASWWGDLLYGKPVHSHVVYNLAETTKHWFVWGDSSSPGVTSSKLLVYRLNNNATYWPTYTRVHMAILFWRSKNKSVQLCIWPLLHLAWRPSIQALALFSNITMMNTLLSDCLHSVPGNVVAVSLKIF